MAGGYSNGFSSGYDVFVAPGGGPGGNLKMLWVGCLLFIVIVFI